MHTQAVSRMQIESDLHKALEQENFVLFYQPQTDLITEHLVGAEALIRFQHPINGLMAPNHFIPILEDTGIIIRLGEWILQTACQQFKVWLDNELPIEHISVNLSPHQFRSKRLTKMVAEAIENSGIPAHCLELEITESLLLEDTKNAMHTLHSFQEMGVRVTIDDFGTGYASLNYLKRFPVDCLKIDKSFIDGVAVDPQDAAITVATIDMAHALGLRVIAEGVETIDQRDFLRDHGCDLAQGFLYSPPIEQHAFHEWAKQYQKVMQQHKR
jgi:EAL domain-containing protein (putative c-di-GMP-specific phosphodiesterase class I)